MTRPAHVPDRLVVDYNAFGKTSIDEALAAARQSQKLGPVLWTDHNGGHWIVTSSAGCRQVLTNPALFNSSSGAGVALVVAERQKYVPLELDGAEHRAYRRAINPLFAPARVNLLGDDVRSIAADLLQKIAVNGRCEIVHEYARPLASSMFLRLMDWPLADREMLEEWVELELNGVPGASLEEQKRVKVEALREMAEYTRAKLRERQASPSDDMTSAIIASTIDGETIPEDMLVNMLGLLMIAGLDTTQSVTSRSVEQLAADARLQEFVRANPDQMPVIVEELLRFGAPAGPNRTAVADTEVEGVAIAAGDRLHCMVQMGNRDDSEFVHPEIINLAREVNRHMTFGLGPHKCIGASLARVVIGAALDELHRAIPSYRLASSTSHLGGVWGMDTVEIEFAAPETVPGRAGLVHAGPAGAVTGEVHVEQRDAVLVITIDRPARRNAINAAAARALAAAMDRLDADERLAVGVLTGAGGTFSSGMDLKAFLDGEVPEVPGRGFGGLTEAPPRKPLIAAVEGWALAGGLELMLACDLAVAGRSARFGVPEVTRGLVASGGGALLLPQRLPLAVALELLLTGQPVDAGRAAAVGLVNRVVDDGDALKAALELARAVAANGPLAVQASKQIARQAREWTVAEGWEGQRARAALVLASADAREGAAAFAEKRAPRWTGR